MKTGYILKDSSISLNSANDIKRILSNYFTQLKIPYFGWVRLFNDGSRASLTNHPKWIKHYYQNGYYNFSLSDRHPSCYQSGYQIWDLCDKQIKRQQIVTRDAEGCFDLGRGLSMIKIHQDGCDIFDFCMHKSDYWANKFYVQHINKFEKFIEYFYDCAHLLIAKAIATKFILQYEDGVDIYEDILDLIPFSVQSKNNSILQSAHLDNITNRPLTSRESECIIWLTKGKTASEIAEILNISAKTVEKYIASIKNKLGCYTLFQLGLKFGFIANIE